MKRFLLCALVLGVLAACDDAGREEFELRGRQSDTIGLSAKEVNAGSGASVTEITTKGKSWWLLDIEIGEELFHLDPMYWSEDFEWSYVDKLKAEFGPDYSPGELTAIRVEGDWFVITRELQLIRIELKPNPTGQERSLKLIVQHGNYFARIRVKQAGTTP